MPSTRPRPRKRPRLDSGRVRLALALDAYRRALFAWMDSGWALALEEPYQAASLNLITVLDDHLITRRRRAPR